MTTNSVSMPARSFGAMSAMLVRVALCPCFLAALETFSASISEFPDSVP